MTRYKLAFAVTKYFEFGGMQRTLLRIALECANRGHDVHVFAGSWVGQKPGELTVHLLDGRALTNHGINRKFAANLKKAIAGRGFDCVAGFTKIPGLDVYYGGDPCFAAKVNETKGRAYKLLPRYRGMKKLEAAVFAADKDTEIILIAHRERDKFIHHYGTDPARFHLLPPGIHRERLIKEISTEKERADLRHQFGLTADGHMVLNVGSKFRTKGLDRALVAFGSLPRSLKDESRLVVIGGDNQRPYVKLAEKLGIAGQVVFTGAREDVAAFYYAADLLIHPSYSENTGTTLVEAMVCGLPVLVTDNCGFAPYVEKASAGLVCPLPFKQQTLNRMLAEMLTSDERSNWSTNGRRFCERTDLYSLIEKSADIIIARAERNRGR